MINKIMKNNGIKAYQEDLKRIDLSKIDKTIQEEKNINYIDDNTEEHKLDIYYKKTNNKKPILINIHGGGFISSYKELDYLFCNYMAQNEFVVFNINYRLAYPKYNVFDQIDDVSNAVKWVIENAKKYEGNINEMYIVGHSAGAVLATIEAMLCNDEQMKKDYNVERNYNYKGLILDCGVMHLYKKSFAYWGMRNMIFPKGYKNTNKYKHLIFENKNISLPKTLLITNEKDELKEMTYYFKDILDKNNINNKLIDQNNEGHMGIIFNPNKEIIKEIKKYMEK